MRKFLLFILFFYSSLQILYSQDNVKEDGVVSFSLPIRNSLKFNKFLINPTFSFVREQGSYLSFYNKKQWVEFDNAPQTYLFSYAGRLRENEGIAIGLFQQNYGVFTTFGAVTNFAHNVVLDQDSNLTFGLNLGFYKSGLNSGKVISNYPDPALDNIPSNVLFSANPGINYGTAFLDFGISLNNLFLYNFKTANMVQDDPEKSIQLHAMHTGYLDSYGFFDKSKFSALLKTDFKKEKTVISGLMMFTIPNGVWAQGGYNTLYGISAGLGLNITSSISMEYNYEKATGNLANFGSSHEITLAYKFKSNKYYQGDEDTEGAIITPVPAKKYVPSKPKTTAAPQNNSVAAAKAKLAGDARIKEYAEAKAKAAALTQAKLAAATKIKADAAAKANAAALTRAKAVAAAKIKADTEAKLVAEAKSKAAALAQAKLDADAKIKADTEAKLVAEAKSKAAALAQAKLDADSQIKADAAAKLLAEAKVKAAALAQAKLDADAKIKADAEAKLVTEAKDDNAKAMKDLTQFIEESKNNQQELLKRLDATVADRSKDLKDLKEQNDLSEKGVFNKPMPFKSISAQNKAFLSLQAEIEQLNKNQNSKIVALENLYKERLKKGNKNDATAQYYLKTIESVKSEQLKVVQLKANLLSSLEIIKEQTEVEKKRRIKRASFENDEGRYLSDVAALNRIKETTPVSKETFKPEDFDYGDEQSNMQILKNIKNVESGYYLIVAVHSDVTKRDAFLTKAVAAGEKNINFFYDVSSSKYFIYYSMFESIEEANKVQESKGNKPYNGKMVMVRVEN